MPLRLLILPLLLLPALAQAHFQELIPTPPLVDSASGNALRLDLRFTHPQAGGPVMAMAAPTRFGVVVDGVEQSLLPLLQADRCADQPCYHADYKVRAPGSYRFFATPTPYWEGAEGKWIIHHTQVVVDAFDAGGGWDTPLGLPLEILPLTRPYALWSGSNFSGVVLHGDKPLPFAKVEVEWRNDEGVRLPGGPYQTLELRADANGSFNFTAPRPGWWGIAALLDEGELPAPDGTPAPVELGGLLWLHFRPMVAQ